MRKLLRLAWILFLIVGLLALNGCAAPAATQGAKSSQEPLVFPTEGPATNPDLPPATPTTPAAILEQRLLTLEWPQRLRQGDSDVVRLTLEMDKSGGLTPTAQIEGHATRGETVQIPNLYDTHTVQAVAELDLAGVEVSPQGPVAQSLLPGERVNFYWSVHAPETGKFTGTAWLKLRFLPKDGGEPVEKMLSAQVFTINSVNLMGIGGAPARVLGGVGALLGGLVGLEDIVNLIKKFWGRKKAAPARPQ